MSPPWGDKAAAAAEEFLLTLAELRHSVEQIEVIVKAHPEAAIHLDVHDAMDEIARGMIKLAEAFSTADELDKAAAGGEEEGGV